MYKGTRCAGIARFQHGSPPVHRLTPQQLDHSGNVLRPTGSRLDTWCGLTTWSYLVRDSVGTASHPTAGEQAMRHARANHASSYWLATVALCMGVLLAGATVAQQDQFPPTAFIVSETFEPPSNTWQVVSGIWSPFEGTFRSTGRGAADISTIVSYRSILAGGGEYTTNLPFEQFTYRARMFNEQGSPSSEVGLVFQYQDPVNYYEVVFSTPGGVLSLRRVINGVVTTLATSSRGTVAPRTWYEIEVQWNAGRTT